MVLGDNGIKEQGPWEEIKVKAGSIAKFTRNQLRGGGQNDGFFISSENFDKLCVQVRATDEAEMDLARQTGDFDLYGRYFVPRIYTLK